MNQGSMKRKSQVGKRLSLISAASGPSPKAGSRSPAPSCLRWLAMAKPWKKRRQMREAIELCLDVMREDGQPIPPPDRDLASPIDQLAPVADADA